MNNKIIQQGAEAIITLENNEIIKDRIKKSYRITEIDDKLRKSRTRSEAKILKKLYPIIPVPKLINSDDKEKITMEYIFGKKLSENLENLDCESICKKIANNIALIHNQNIIHGDLTSSNMIYNEKSSNVYFIDFGLAFHSERIEDKAVDLHLLFQALEAKHFNISEKSFKIILNEYEKHAKLGKEIIHRIKVIESRGRYKEKF